MRYLHRIQLFNPIIASIIDSGEDEMKTKHIDVFELPFNAAQNEYDYSVDSAFKSFYFQRYRNFQVNVDLTGLNPQDGDTYYFHCERGNSNNNSNQKYLFKDVNRSIQSSGNHDVYFGLFANGLTSANYDILVVFSYWQAKSMWIYSAIPMVKSEFDLGSNYIWNNSGGN